MRDGASSLKIRSSSLPWNRRYALGVSWKLPPRLFEALLLGHLAQVVLDLLLQGAELLDVARLGELGERLHVDDADLGRLAGLFELLEQLVDRLQLFLDLHAPAARSAPRGR